LILGNWNWISEFSYCDLVLWNLVWSVGSKIGVIFTIPYPQGCSIHFKQTSSAEGWETIFMSHPSTPIPKSSDQSLNAPAHTAGLPFNLVARFSRQMKPQRLYPLVVQLRRNKRQTDDGSIGTLHLRPVIPGAIVTPTDYTLDLDHPVTNPPFYVAPLAKGILRNARMEIFQQGRLVGTIALPMKTVRQTFTWFMLFLTIAIPCTTFWLARYTNFTRSGTIVATKTDDEDNDLKLTEDDGIKKPNQSDEGKGEKASPSFPKIQNSEGGIERSLKRVLPEASFSQTVATAAQDTYDAVHYGSDYNLSFYLAVVLMGLTCMSWAMHTTRGCRRKARPVER
jgi:hypothetical protein